MAQDPRPEGDARPKNPCLPEAVEDAQLLLAFASQNGKDVEPEIVKVIVETGALTAAGGISVEQEAAFWGAFNALARKIQPVSVTSLKATLDSLARQDTTLFGVRMGGGSQARKAVWWYTAVAIAALLAVLVFQVYWLLGTSTTTEIQKTKQEALELDLKFRALQKAAVQPADKKAQLAEVRKPEDPDILAVKSQIQNLSLRKEASYELLNIWSMPWRWLMPRVGQAAADDPGAKKAGEAIARFETALSVLEVLQRYILPLFYGLLGSCVWILRSLTTEIRERTYTEAANIGFRIRLYLGTLSGIVFAWFITPETADGLFKSLSPFALAFLAGYSVELLFAVMDRFLAAFTSKTTST